MTAVLSATDALRRDRVMASHDDNQINYSSSNAVDWKAKYDEAADMLAETRAELDDFQRSSKELEDELVRELEHNEKAQQDLRVKVAKAETERDEWKSRFMQLQTTHNSTTTSLQRELDQLRQEHQKLKVQMRELEMGNDDLERNERAVSSTLADVEAKYGRVLEEKILIEQELYEKAKVEEECQRLKDEIRDANTEINVLREQLNTAQKRLASASSVMSSTTSSLKKQVVSSDDDIMKTSPPDDILLTDETAAASSSSDPPSPAEELSKFDTARPVAPKLDAQAGQSVLLKRAGFPSQWASNTPPNGTRPGLTRSSTLASYSPSRLPMSSPTPRPTINTRNITEPVAGTSNSASIHPATASRSRGVQMVSEMRARVRNLEQKLHTRVPRLRMGSISTKSSSSSASSSVANLLGRTSSGSDGPRLGLKRRSADLDNEKKRAPSNQNKKETQDAKDTSGWVLIMEDAMTPTPTRENGRRRLSSPSVSPYLPSSITAKAFGSASNLPSTNHSNSRRPHSRLSTGTADGRDSYNGRDSISTASTTSSIATPTSRPATPTFLPIPSTGSYTSGLSQGKRSTGPGIKRSSLGSTPSTPTTLLHPPNFLSDRPSSVLSSTSKSLPMPPPNVTVRTSRPSSAIGQSRIGRPSGLGSGRRSTGAEEETKSRLLDEKNMKDGRARAGSTGTALR